MLIKSGGYTQTMHPDHPRPPGPDTILKRMKDKHDPYVQSKAIIKEWTDSAPVVRLSAYLKKHKNQGMELITRNGQPTLHFTPPISRWQVERMDHASVALTLMQEAHHDLMFCIENRLIDLREHFVFIAGPFRTNLYGKGNGEFEI
jgi:hypothetical protein